MSANTDFTLSKTAYATFDAVSLKQLIKDRLTSKGVFTDQIFEGSNLSALIDIIAFSYHVTLFQLNQTASETMFSDAELYENINRIVKLVGYKPTGYRTSILSFEAEADQTLSVGIYTIRKFSYLNVNGIRYTFLDDVTFSKNTTGVESLDTLFKDNVLYQGSIFEYPPYQPVGGGFETLTIVLKDPITNTIVPIDLEGITVYTYINGKYVEFTEVDSIFESDDLSYTYEKRVNENGFYELKFGNGVYGYSLTPNDIVYVYYLKSDGVTGILSPNQLNGSSLVVYSTPQFEKITAQIYANVNIFEGQEISTITFTNPYGSTKPSERETVDQIKQNVPKIFNSQNRLVTTTDIETYIKKRYSNIVADVKVVNNRSYIDNVVKYYYEIGLDRPNDDSRILANTVSFSTAGQTNNIYVYMLPKLKTVDSNNNLFYATQSQKNEIIQNVNKLKAANMETIAMDPVYVAITVGISTPGEETVVDDYQTTYLVIEKEYNSLINNQKIKDEVNQVFVDYFSSDDNVLGRTIEINEIQGNILRINGVRGIKTRKVVDGVVVHEVPFINLQCFSYVYKDADVIDTGSNISLPYFKYPFLLDGSVESRIIIEESNA